MIPRSADEEAIVARGEGLVVRAVGERVELGWMILLLLRLGGSFHGVRVIGSELCGGWGREMGWGGVDL